MRIAIVLVLAACESAASLPTREPSPPPGPRRIVEPAPAPTRTLTAPNRKALTRAAIEHWVPRLPERGLFATWMGIGSRSHVMLDADTRAITRHVEPYLEQAPADVTTTLASDQVERLWRLAETAWRADRPKHADVTDYREVIVAVDGDEVLWISVHGPIEPGEPALALSTALRQAGGL